MSIHENEWGILEPEDKRPYSRCFDCSHFTYDEDIVDDYGFCCDMKAFIAKVDAMTDEYDGDACGAFER